MRKSKRFFVSGSLQPVLFNKFIKDNADRLGIKGFVRHLEDGRMEIFVEGTIDMMTKMVPLCRKGPQHSIIRDVIEKEESHQGFSDFKVLNF